MRLTRVTLTGADDSIRPNKLIELSKKYPFVEWGILLSRKQKGNNRFPSTAWMDELARQLRFEKAELNFSGHLCGAYVKEALIGNTSFAFEIGNLWRSFQRIQINTHGERHEWTKNGLDKAMNEFASKEFIFQYDKVHDDIIEFAKGFTDISALFDLSHGAGIEPEEWPQPLKGINCGYAGGMSPGNVESHVKKIEAFESNDEFWIDMETKVRSGHDQQFDLDKVEAVLKSCKPYIIQ